MDIKPQISVIVPIYGTEKYLAKCLDSLAKQTLKNVEFICVDDASPDQSSEVVQKYINADKRFRLIRHKINKGQGGARNTGIRAAQADFIASVDSDDSIAPNMLERLWVSSEYGKYDVTCCGFIRVSTNNTEITRRAFKPRFIDNSKQVINIFTVANPAIWNKLWRKSLFVDHDIFFPEKLYYQDMATIPLLLSKANKINFIEDCLYYYLVRDGSVTTTYSPKHIIDYFKVYEILYDALERLELIERYSIELRNSLSEGMRFHSSNVIQSSMSEYEITQYLRYMLIMKVSFIELNQKLKSFHQKDLLDHLKKTTFFSELQLCKADKQLNELDIGLSETGRPINDIPTFNSNLNLNSFQKSGIKIFGLIFRPFILPKQMKKLNEHPLGFFQDSKNRFARILGKFLGLI